MHTAYDGELPEGWQGGVPVTKHWNGDFIHLYRVTRPCATCQAEISLAVTKRALEGKAKNAGLLLRNCPECRKARKAGGIGSRGGTSRPVAGEPVPAVDSAELESLRLANSTMKEELEGLYVTIKELRERYELAPAVEAISFEAAKSVKPQPPAKAVPAFKPPLGPLMPQYIGENAVKPPHNGFQQNKSKMPWEGG